ncbi:membrane protein [Actinoplanes italicus]|uniref:Putative membrane protein YczE n=1 Tax=Actinoplanes italicus TaxID=113567 RepID=A0A2T0KKM2_9ACTN|nr:hypothetical protein [Actinoplanes italicus]PRX23866.1 putative membrane protein YczE [Actinoplanes italicus]GIE35004.1 membrane protein [Actinoplanes italicus]
MNLYRRLPQLFAGLVLYGVSTALMIESGLGLNPWDVFHQGLSEVTGIRFGWIVLLVGVPVLLLWIPLRQRPGFGTVANLVVVGFAADVSLALLPTGEAVPARVGLLVSGILLNGFATGLYLGSRMGPGPRDGLMTGLAARFPKVSLRVIRTGIELTVLGAGFLLGGTVGVGTIAYALAIGPLVHLFLPKLLVPQSVPSDLPIPGDTTEAVGPATGPQ